MHRGYIKIWRKIVEWEWYKTPNMFHFFIHLLLTANYKETRYMGHVIPRGSLVCGLLKLSEQTGISIQGIRTCINNLKSTGELTRKTTNKFSIITICNYELYQDIKDDINKQDNKQDNNQSTINQQSTNNQLTTSKELKNDNNEKNNTNTRSWRNDYQIYHDQCNAAFDKLLEDWNWIKERKRYHPGLNIRESTRKMFFDFWEKKELGWKNKKSSKTKEIDWEATINNGLTMKCNQVWIQKGARDEEFEFIQMMEKRSQNA